MPLHRHRRRYRIPKLLWHLDTIDEGMNTIQLAGTDWNDAVKAYNTRRAQIAGEIVARVSAYFGFELPVTFPYYQGANAGAPVQNPLATTATP